MIRYRLNPRMARVVASAVRFVRYPRPDANVSTPPGDAPDGALLLPGGMWLALPDGASLALPAGT